MAGLERQFVYFLLQHRWCLPFPAAWSTLAVFDHLLWLWLGLNALYALWYYLCSLLRQYFVTFSDNSWLAAFTPCLIASVFFVSSLIRQGDFGSIHHGLGVDPDSSLSAWHDSRMLIRPVRCLCKGGSGIHSISYKTRCLCSLAWPKHKRVF